MFSPFLFIFWSLFLEPCPHFPEIHLTNRLINVDLISYEVKYYEERRGEEKEGLNKRRSKKIGKYWEEGETKMRLKN